MMDNTMLIQVDKLALHRVGRELFSDLSFHLRAGERLAIMGSSGSGKSSLLQAFLGRLTVGGRYVHGRHWPRVVAGTIQLGGIPIKRRREWPGWLSANAGILFQSGALFEGRSVKYNLSFPFRYMPPNADRSSPRPDTKTLSEALVQVGLIDEETAHNVADNFLKKRVRDLSGGEQKRVALARALVLRPRLLLLDEPTSGLDSYNSSLVAETIRNLSQLHNVAILCITHDPRFVEQVEFNKLVELKTLPAKNDKQLLLSVKGIERGGWSSAPSPLQSPMAKRLSLFIRKGWQRIVMMTSQTVMRAVQIIINGALVCVPVGLIAGAGLTIQSVAAPRLVQSFLAQGVVAAIFHGMGTIVPALLVIALCASGLTGELAQRKHGNQLEYLRLLGVKPWIILGIPIVLALLFVLPLLIWLTELMMLTGGAIALRFYETRYAMTATRYWNEVWRLIDEAMWQRSAIKGVTHGGLIGLVACFFGFMCGTGEDGLRRAVARCVLFSTLLIIIADVMWSWYWSI